MVLLSETAQLVDGGNSATGVTAIPLDETARCAGKSGLDGNAWKIRRNRRSGTAKRKLSAVPLMLPDQLRHELKVPLSNDVEVTVSTLLVLIFAAGLPKLGWLMTLNASARNSPLSLSRIAKFLIAERANSAVSGPRRTFHVTIP